MYVYIYISIYTHIYNILYIYIYVCVCVCVFMCECICSLFSVMIGGLDITTDTFIYSLSKYLGIYALYVVSNYLLQIIQRGW